MADAQAKSSPEDPPAMNQGKDEPVATTPTESAQSSDSGGGAGSGGREASGGGEAGDPGADRDPEPAETMPSQHDGGVPTPGDAGGVPVPSVDAAAGSSETGDEVQDVASIARAAPGKPDGEVDTRG